MSDFHDVRAGDGESLYTVHRFTGTPEGAKRAKEYADGFNASLREAMGVTEADLLLERADHGNRPDEYDRALRAETYREHSAYVRGASGIPVIGDTDPMPTEYPHGF